MDPLVVDLLFRDRVLATVPFDRPTLRIGRMPENDVVIDNLAVSRFHARLHLAEGGVELEDASSENGCFVNGARVEGRAAVRPGDRIAVGKHELRIRPAAPEELAGPRPARRKGEAWDGARTYLVELAGTTTRTASLASRPSRDHRKEAVPMRDANPQPHALEAEAVVEKVGPEDAQVIGAEPEAAAATGPGAPELDFGFHGSLAEQSDAAQAAPGPRPDAPLHAGFLVQRGGKLECIAPWPGEKVVAGRSADCDIVLAQEEVSRRHASFERSGERFEVKDLGSVNGTFVNGSRIERAELRVGDVIQIEGFRLTFVLDREPLESAVAAPNRAASAAASPAANDRFAMTMLQEQMPQGFGEDLATAGPQAQRPVATPGPESDLPEGDLFGDEIEGAATAAGPDEKPEPGLVAPSRGPSSRASSVQDLHRVGRSSAAGRDVVFELRLRVDLLPPALREAFEQAGAADLILPAELRVKGSEGQ